MSRVGKKPVPIPEGVELKIEGTLVKVKGPKGTIQRRMHPEISLKIEDGRLLVERPSNLPRHRALHGTARVLVANMIKGVTAGFTKELEIQGIGYKAQMEGKNLVMNLSMSHPFTFEPPEGVTIETPQPTKVVVSGIDWEAVGQAAADIRAADPPEPYKGKGIRYAGEYVRRKAGKAGAAQA
jgi:large subunit ribosomal protein L6